jgi:hypothetical protein
MSEDIVKETKKIVEESGWDFKAPIVTEDTNLLTASDIRRFVERIEEFPRNNFRYVLTEQVARDLGLLEDTKPEEFTYQMSPYSAREQAKLEAKIRSDYAEQTNTVGGDIPKS